MPAEYGTIISTLEGPTTRRFSFVVNPTANVRRGQFVQLETADGKLIGRIADIMKTNRYFMRPESVKEYESSGKPMDEIFPVNDWEYLVANVIALGVFGKSGFVDSSFPPSPGSRVLEPELEILSGFFGLDRNGLQIGSLAQHDVSVSLNLTRLLQKHVAILAISGAGKSFLTSVIIEELLSRKPEEGIAVIVVDTHGEYTSFADDAKYSAKTRIFPSNEIQIGLSNVSSHTLAEFSPDVSAAQRRELAKVMMALKRKNKHFGMTELIEAVEESDGIKAATKDVLISTLEELRNTGLFGALDYPPLDDLARQGCLSVLDISDMIDTKRKQMAVAYMARKLFNARRSGVIPPFLLIVEEAHQFVPEQAKREIALSRGIITTIAREGRKFNASLCLISQRPIQLSTTALSQCNTHIILKITNPYDLDHIGKSSEGLTRDVIRQISSLPVGSGIIVGEAVNSPLFVRFRRRSSRPSQKGMSIEQAAKEYHDRVRQKTKDAKSFM